MSSKNEHRSFKILSNILTYPIVCNKVEFLFQPTCKLSTGERRKFVLSTFFSGLCNLCVVFTLENLLQYYYYLGSIFFVQGVDFSGQSIQQLFLVVQTCMYYTSVHSIYQIQVGKGSVGEHFTKISICSFAKCLYYQIFTLVEIF